MELIIILLITFVLVLYTSFSWGYVAFKFYGWFITPYFTDLPQFSVTHFVGFLLFVSVMTHKSHTMVKDEYRDKNHEYSVLILSPWLSLLLGYILYSFYF